MATRISAGLARAIKTKKTKSLIAPVQPTGKLTAFFDSDKREVVFRAPLTPKTKSRARTFYSMKAIRAAFLESRGNPDRFVALLKAETITPTKTAEFEKSLREILAIAMK